jgi:threonine dehydrogenase-like Zn-dependent dehydrogenase
MGFTHDGGYGRYELVHESNFFSIPTALPLAEATLLLDVMGTTGHAFARARLVADDVRAVAVSGAGPIGLGLVVMGRLVLGADVPVVVADVQSTRLELIGELGGHPVDLRATTLSGGLRALGLTEVDVAIDTAGKSASRRMLLDVLAKRGALVCVGHGEGLELTISPDLIAPERTILGSEYFRFDELPGNLDLLREHMDELAPIITHRFPVDELSRAFELFMSGRPAKSSSSNERHVCRRANGRRGILVIRVQANACRGRRDRDLVGSTAFACLRRSPRRRCGRSRWPHERDSGPAGEGGRSSRLHRRDPDGGARTA